MSAAEVTAFLDREFPQLLSGHGRFVIESVGPLTARVRLMYDERHLRPGGTLSGPSMFGLCDVSLDIAILAQIGPVALAVTTNLNINFHRRAISSVRAG
jgi:acyl-coenzyme A thioesterase PaaI-like protein